MYPILKERVHMSICVLHVVVRALLRFMTLRVIFCVYMDGLTNTTMHNSGGWLASRDHNYLYGKLLMHINAIQSITRAIIPGRRWPIFRVMAVCRSVNETEIGTHHVTAQKVLYVTSSYTAESIPGHAMIGRGSCKG